MPTYEIIGIDRHYLCDHNVRLGGLYLKGVVGSVDPFVDGQFMPDCLKIFIDDNDNIIEGKTAEYFAAEIEWGKSQIGKKLVCDDLAYHAFATHGKVEIEA